MADDLVRQNAVLRAENQRLVAKAAALEQKLEQLQLILQQGMAPEIDQLVAIFANTMKLLKP